jgi:hypothetical protein
MWYVYFSILCISLIASSTSSKKRVTLLTFDVDGTLVQGSSQAASRSVHSRSFNYAVSRVYDDDRVATLGHPLAVIPSEKFHGSTDGLISLNIAKFGLGLNSSVTFPKLQSVFEEMFTFVEGHSDAEVSEGIQALPGVILKLERLALERAEGNVMCGLVTGNVEGIARKKMRAVGVLQTNALSPASEEQLRRKWGNGDYEDCAFLGGFGSDYCSGDLDDLTRNWKDRGEQILIAVRRAKSMLDANTHVLDRVVHIGDAIADIKAATHARDNLGDEICVGVIGVATGKWSKADLTAACGAYKAGSYEPVVLEDGINDPKFLTHCLPHTQF